MKKLDQTVIFLLLSIAIGYSPKKTSSEDFACLLACLLLLRSLLASFLGFGYFWLDLLPLVFVDLFCSVTSFCFLNS
jgi:hypothetical protein